METGSSMADLPKENSPNEDSPLIVRREDKEDDESGGRRGRVFDSLLDKAGYGFFHVILLLGMYIYIYIYIIYIYIYI